MMISFGNAAIDVRHLMLQPKSIREGDFICYRGDLLKVVTIQRGCPRLENLGSDFTMFTLKAATGQVLPVREITGRTRFETYRPKGKAA